jgi:hypothetical protein
MKTLLDRPLGVIKEANAPPPTGNRMYAIAFDVDIESLQHLYPGNTPKNGSKTSAKFSSSTASCGSMAPYTSAIRQESTRWRASCLPSGSPATCLGSPEACAIIRMLRIEENNDLLPAITGASS